MFALCLVTFQNLLRGCGGYSLLLLPLSGCQIHGSPAVCGSHKEKQETQRDRKRNTEKCKYCYIDKPRSLLSLPLSRSRSPTLPLSLTLILWYQRRWLSVGISVEVRIPRIALRQLQPFTVAPTPHRTGTGNWEQQHPSVEQQIRWLWLRWY